MSEPWTPKRRVLVTLSHQEPDRVPIAINSILHGPSAASMSLEEFMKDPDAIASTMVGLHRHLGTDVLFGVPYAAVESEAWGGEAVFRSEGPPIVGQLPFRSVGTAAQAKVPDINACPSTLCVLNTIQRMRSQVGPDVPIMGMALAPFSLAAIQIGLIEMFEAIHRSPDSFERLMELNTRFCIGWANAQIEAGVDAIALVDAAGSPMIASRAERSRWAAVALRHAVAGIKGPVVVHFASAKCLDALGAVIRSGAIGVGVGFDESLHEVRALCRGKLALVGNLNALAMHEWSVLDADRAVRNCLRSAHGGGFILSDSHGEIPAAVPFSIIEAVCEAARSWGRYPLSWDSEESHVAATQDSCLLDLCP